MESASSINLFTSPETANDPVRSAQLTAASIASLAAARIESGDLSADLASQLQEISRQLAEAESQNRLTEAELAARAKALEREAKTLVRLREDFERSRDQWETSQEQLIKKQQQWTQQVQKQDNLLQQRLEQLEAYSFQLKNMPTASAEEATNSFIAPILESRISHQREAQLEAMLRDSQDRETELLRENSELETKIESLMGDLSTALGKGAERLRREDYAVMADELQTAQQDSDRLRHQLNQQDAEIESLRAELETLRASRPAMDSVTANEAALLASMQSLAAEAESQEAFRQDLLKQVESEKESLRHEILKQAEAEKESLRQEILKQAEAEREVLRQEILEQAEAEKEALKQEFMEQAVRSQEAFQREILEKATEGQEALKQQILEQTTAEQESLKQRLEQAVAESETLKQHLEEAAMTRETLKREFAEQAIRNQETLKQQLWDQTLEEKKALQQKFQQKEASYQQALEEAQQRFTQLQNEYAFSMARLEEADEEAIHTQGEVAGSEETAKLEEEIDSLKRRYEMAMDDLKELKAENQTLRENLENTATRPAVGKASSHGASQAPGDFLDWEEEKRRLMAMLESDFQEDEPATPEEQMAASTERIKMEDLIEQTDRVIQIKIQEIEELKSLLENQSSQVGNLSVGIGAFEAAFNHDELISEERENLKRLQQELHEKLKKAEVEISIERAKVAREKAEINDMLGSLGLTREKIAAAIEESMKQEASEGEEKLRAINPKSNKQARWFNKMGIKDDDEA